MQALKRSVSLPDPTHPDMQLRLSTDDLACAVVITLPASPSNVASPGTLIRLPSGKDAQASAANDASVPGGHTGI